MIEFRDVYFRYAKKSPDILKGISFKITDGELVALVGKNGAGKTTLLKHIIGLLKPTKGEVWINNENIIKKPISELAQTVGLAFQNPNHQLFAETVEKELAFGPKNLGMPEEEQKRMVQKIAENFNITHLLRKSPLELSGGERRLVSIASVLTMGQKILVLDEPTFGQDYRQKKRLGTYLCDLRNKGVTVFIVTHDIDFILDYFPRVIVLVDGQIIADGESKTILQDELLIQQADLEKPILLEIQEKVAKMTNQEYLPATSEVEFIEKLKDILLQAASQEGKK